MDIVVRAATVYLFVLLLVRVRGKKSINQLEVFDFVLLLIISEATQQAMLGDDFSVTNGILVVASLISIDLLLSFAKQHMPKFNRVISGMPTVLMAEGELLHDAMATEGIDEDDIMESARSSQGLERLDQIRHVVMERNGSLSIIPRG